jgi:hypothetical protein
MITYSLVALPHLKLLSELKLNNDEISKFMDNRIKNYLKITDSCKGINAEYFDKIISYQVQLISGICKYNMLSYYNPFIGNTSEQIPVNLNASEIQSINSILSFFVTDKIIPYLGTIDNYFLEERQH